MSRIHVHSFKEGCVSPTHLWFSVLILGALQHVVDNPASGGIGEEGLSVVDGEAEKDTKLSGSLQNIQHASTYQHHPLDESRDDNNRKFIKKPHSRGEVCFHWKRRYFPKKARREKRKVETVGWRMRLDEAFHQNGASRRGKNNRKELEQECHHFTNVCCCIFAHLINDQLDSQFCVKGPVAHRILVREHRFLLLAAKQDGEFSQTAHLHITKGRVFLLLWQKQKQI